MSLGLDKNMGLESCPKCNEPIYSGTNRCPHCGSGLALLQYNDTLEANKQKTKEIEGHLTEYRRTCQVCGKVWHSLVSREKKIEKRHTSDTCKLCSESMNVCGPNTTKAQLQRNLDAHESELQRLQSCPECSSANYIEEIINHEVKDMQ